MVDGENGGGLIGTCEIVVPGYEDGDLEGEIPVVVGAGGFPSITVPTIGTFCSTLELGRKD